jgi:acyl-coenzyme A synthetase/AMP-(fatty) acid ligase
VMAAIPRARFSNLFGPTETNVCTFYHVPSPVVSDEPVPIGRPCENVEALIVDELDTAVAAGEPGELLIRGGVVMRGYWGRPDLNARGFHRRQVFDGHYEDVFYRTGDLVEALPDGNLKYLGRKDRQVKTRGYRVELDEVEAALLSCAAVEEAAAYTVPDGQGSSLIAAAVTARNGEPLAAAVVAAHVAERLPMYAVPVDIRVMDVFPRTSSGKIDRRALAAANQAVLGSPSQH